jgi:hypothetical protein
MLKKMMTLAGVLVLLTLLAAPLVLAQQGTDQQAPDQQGVAQPAAGGTQPSLPTLEDPFRFNSSGNVVIDCDAAYRNFVRLELANDTSANDPEVQSELAQAQNLVEICVFEGSGSQSGGNGIDQYQPNGPLTGPPNGPPNGPPTGPPYG